MLDDGVTMLYGWRHAFANHHGLPWAGEEGVTHWSTMCLLRGIDSDRVVAPFSALVR